MAISAPPPMQAPRMNAMLGLGNSARARSASSLARVYSSKGRSPRPLMSPPAQKWSPTPRTTRTRTDGSVPNSVASAASSSHIA